MRRAIKIAALAWILAVIGIACHALWLVNRGMTYSRSWSSVARASSGGSAFFVVQRADRSTTEINSRPLWRQYLIEFNDAPHGSGKITRTLVSESIESNRAIRFHDSSTGGSTTLPITWSTNYISWVNGGRAIAFKEGSGEFTIAPVSNFERRWDTDVVREFILERLAYVGLALVMAIVLGAFLVSLTVRFPRSGRCVRCGYDLRGNASDESGCPECGWGRAAQHGDEGAAT